MKNQAEEKLQRAAASVAGGGAEGFYSRSEGVCGGVRTPPRRCSTAERYKLETET